MTTLLDLPTETLNRIASFLPNANEILRYAWTCRRTLDVVYDARAPLWRTFFADLYDLPAGKAVTALRLKCVQRDTLRCRTIFKLGNGSGARRRYDKYEERALHCMRDLVVESFSSPNRQPTASHNVKTLLDFATNTNILDAEKYWLGRERPTRLLQAMHLMLLVPQLDAIPFRTPSCTLEEQYPIIQKAVYTHPNATGGLFAKDACMTVNLDLVGQIATFFKYHMSAYEEHTLFEPFWYLTTNEKPKMWTDQLMQGHQKLGRRWKGTYAWLAPQDIELVRRLDDPTTEVIADFMVLSPQGGLYEFELDFEHADMSHGQWPQAWEDLLESTPSVRLLEALKQWPADWIKSQADPRKFTNKVTTSYLKESHLDHEMQEYEWRQEVEKAKLQTKPNNPHEWDHLERTFLASREPASISPPQKKKKRPAPLTKNPVPGQDYLHFTGTGSEDSMPYTLRGNVHAVAPVEDIPGWQRISFMQHFPHNHKLVCYEGVVLPGNQIILGRFWHADDHAGRTVFGPFIYWNVD